MKLWKISLGVIVLLLVPVACSAGLISFSGQFDPSLATFTTGGNGWFDPSGAPLTVQLWGSDSHQVTGVLTQVTWTVVTGDPNLQFHWLYQTFDAGTPYWDPAGYVLNGVLTQLSNDSGSSIQSGFVSGISISPGDQFGFYVYSVDDAWGPATISISGVPEPATAILLGLGLAAVGLLGGRRQ